MPSSDWDNAAHNPTRLSLTDEILTRDGSDESNRTVYINTAEEIAALLDTSVALTARHATFKLLTEVVNSVAATGATETIPATTVATINRLVLDQNCTLTFPTAAAGLSFRLVLVQGASVGSFLATWPAAVKWAGGTAPTLSTAVNKIDHFFFVCVDGTNWLGSTVGLDMR